MAPNPTAHYIDLKALIKRQLGERYRSLLILADDAGERSRQAQRLAEATGAAYLNLLDTFEARPALRTRIDRFDIDELEELLLGLEMPQEVVVVDAIDFLFNTWRPEQRAAFVRVLLDRRLDTLERGAKLFVFFALDDVYLRQYELTNTWDQRRVHRLSEVSF
jgi:hypothetical protein